MEIKELKNRVPNIELILQNTCKTSISNFIELEKPTIFDKKLLLWGPMSKELKIVGPVSFYKNTLIGIVVFDKKSNTIFINKNAIESYKLFKKSYTIKKIENG